MALLKELAIEVCLTVLVSFDKSLSQIILPQHLGPFLFIYDYIVNVKIECVEYRCQIEQFSSDFLLN
jgi:hypothetical protein